MDGRARPKRLWARQEWSWLLNEFLAMDDSKRPDNVVKLPPATS
jgi:hypothetical protein